MNEAEHYWQDRGMDYRARPMECQFCGRNYLKPCGANEFDRCGNFLHLQTKANLRGPAGGRRGDL